MENILKGVKLVVVNGQAIYQENHISMTDKNSINQPENEIVLNKEVD